MDLRFEHFHEAYASYRTKPVEDVCSRTARDMGIQGKISLWKPYVSGVQDTWFLTGSETCICQT